MPEIVSFHSFRGGTGKSSIAANVAVLLAAQGRRVGVLDADLASPGIHVLFGLDQSTLTHSLNDFLWGKCTIEEAAHDVTAALGHDLAGRVLLVPASINAGEIAHVLREGYDVSLLHEGYHALIAKLGLDVLIIDTHPGLNEETLLSVVTSNALAVVMRPDEQDYQGTAVTVQVARLLKVPRMVMIVNKTPSVFDVAEVKARVETTFGCEVAAVLPHSEELMVLSSRSIFVLGYPDHPLTALYKQVAASLVLSN